MRPKRNTLKIVILLGLFFSSWTIKYPWPIIPFLYIAYGFLGVAALQFPTAKYKVFRAGEWLLFSLALAAAVLMNLRYPGQYWVLISVSLVVYQLSRLFHPMNARQARLALGVALVHLGLSATRVVSPLPFLVLMGLAVYFVPQAFYQMEAERLLMAKESAGAGDKAKARDKEKAGRFPRLSGRMARTAVLLGLMAVFFVGLPRFRLFDHDGVGDGFGLGNVALRRSMDMADRLAGTYFEDRLLYKVYGRDLGYMKVDALYEFDGRIWRQTRASFGMDERRALNAPYEPGMRERKVRLFTPDGIGISLPTDHFPERLMLWEAHPVYVARHGAVLAKPPIPAGFIYKYWTTPKPEMVLPLLPGAAEELTDLGGYTPSSRLRAWLEARWDTAATDRKNAQGLVKTFRDNFTYDLRAAALDETRPLEDFLFDQRRGHCERYASALAILLRMRDIPARVARGFVAQEYNSFGEYYNVRGKHAHAWVEAWFPETGWMTLDPTPPDAAFSARQLSYARSVYEHVTDLWQMEVVMFDQVSQKRLLFAGQDRLKAWAGKGPTVLFWAVLGLLAALAVYGIIRWTARGPFGPHRQAKQERQRLRATHFYARLLRRLAKAGYVKAPQQTPLEFARQLAAQNHPEIDTIRDITERFCVLRYGNK